MRYTLEDLIKSYNDNKIHRNMIDCDIRLYKLEGKEPIEYIENLEKEKELYDKKVKIVEDYFIEDTGAVAPIEQHLSHLQYKVCECIYIKNITNRQEIAEILNVNKDYVSTCVTNSMKKIRQIEINI